MYLINLMGVFALEQTVVGAKSGRSSILMNRAPPFTPQQQQVFPLTIILSIKLPYQTPPSLTIYFSALLLVLKI